MRQILNALYSKLVKKLPSEIEEAEDEVLDIVAFFNVGINDKDEIIISSDFLDNHEDAMAKLVYLLCSGTLIETINGIVEKRCEGDEQLKDRILASAYNMMMYSLSTMMQNSDDDDDNDDDDNEPVVDPCFVFQPKNTGEEEDEEDD